MLIEMASIIAALAFAVLVAYAVLALIQARKTLAELQLVLLTLNSQLPSLLKDLRMMTENVNALTDEARTGVAHASGFLQAVGAVGQTVGTVQGLVSGQGLLSKLGGLAAGIKAASAVVKERFSRHAGGVNGDDPR